MIRENDFRHCGCGRVHTCPIAHIEIGAGVLERIPALLADFRRILLVADENTAAVAGNRLALLLGTRVAHYLVLRSEGAVLVPNEESLAAIEHAATDTDLVLGVGAGVINDLCKQASFARGLPYDIVATAPSMDGYASSGAALILGGMKVTKNARPPRAIYADTAILKNAPLRMLQAGYGDIVGKFSCLSDWRLAALLRGEYFCPAIHDETLRVCREVAPLAKRLLRREEDAVGALMEALVAVGMMMSFVGNSRPASGSEHHLSHFFEITGLLRGEAYLPHGIDVLYSTYCTSRLREALLLAPAPTHADADTPYDEAGLRAAYGALYPEVAALADKVGLYREARTERYIPLWGEVCRLLAEPPPAEEIAGYIRAIGLSLDEFFALYSKEHLISALAFAKDLKDRYTVLWLAYDRLYPRYASILEKEAEDK